MVTQLRVVNDCLAIMGEAPLNSLVEDHEYKTAIVNKLTDELTRIAAKSWWFNTENLSLKADARDNRIYLPNDTASVRVVDGGWNVVQRGRVLYDLDNGTDVFPTDTLKKVVLIRSLSIDQLPTLAAEYVATEVVLWFQNTYDGDQTKTRNLEVRRAKLETDLGAEHIRQRKVNLQDQSQRLQKIRQAVKR